MISRRSLIASGALVGGSVATGLFLRRRHQMLPETDHAQMGAGSRHAGHMMRSNGDRLLALPEGASLPELPRLKNTATVVGRFEGRLAAGPANAEFVRGKPTEVWAYNDTSPGPLIELNEGDDVALTFENKLAQTSTIHWHGLDAPADQDGNPMNPVAAGMSRTYAFRLRADNTGPFWYHPHPHGTTAQQVYMGLAGAVVVMPKFDPLAALPQTTLFVTALSLLQDGRIAPNTMIDQMNGREGDHILVNGAKNPVLSVQPGSSRRFRIYNATNGRYLRLALPQQSIALVGTDGGYLSQPVSNQSEIILAPAERVEIVVTFQPYAGRVSLQDLPYDRGWMGPGKPAAEARPILTFDVRGALEEAFALPSHLRDITPLGDPTASKTLTLGEKMGMSPSGMSMEFLINGRAFDMNRVDLTSRVGEIEVWDVNNPTDTDHPFHIHGTQFRVLKRSRNATTSKAPFLGWKDTVNVARGETVRLALPQHLRGRRIYHCHILEHEDQGMMGQVDVV